MNLGDIFAFTNGHSRLAQKKQIHSHRPNYFREEVNMFTASSEK